MGVVVLEEHVEVHAHGVHVAFVEGGGGGDIGELDRASDVAAGEAVGAVNDVVAGGAEVAGVGFAVEGSGVGAVFGAHFTEAAHDIRRGAGRVSFRFGMNRRRDWQCVKAHRKWGTGR